MCSCWACFLSLRSGLSSQAASAIRLGSYLLSSRPMSHRTSGTWSCIIPQGRAHGGTSTSGAYCIEALPIRSRSEARPILYGPEPNLRRSVCVLCPLPPCSSLFPLVGSSAPTLALRVNHQIMLEMSTAALYQGIATMCHLRAITTVDQFDSR